MIERFDYKQQRLIMVDLEGLVDGPFKLDWEALHFGSLDGVRDFTIGAQQSASINLEAIFAAHQAELDGEPKKPRHCANDAGEAVDARFWITDARHQISCGVCAFAEPHQR